MGHGLVILHHISEFILDITLKEDCLLLLHRGFHVVINSFKDAFHAAYREQARLS